MVNGFLGLEQVGRPIISLMVRKPSCAINSRTSCPMKRNEIDGVGGVAREILRKIGFLRRHAHRQVSRWQHAS